MGYLNTSMTKRADLSTAAIFGIPSALGAAAGGLAGYHGSDKSNNKPATVLGAIGGGEGALAGVVAGANVAGSLIDKLNDTEDVLKQLAELTDDAQELANNREILNKRLSLLKKIGDTPALIRYVAKHPKLRHALTLGSFGSIVTAGGTLGAILGAKGGDALV